MAIKLTDSAAERVAHFLRQQGGAGLRLGVRKTGCSGWAYVVDLTEQIGPDDVTFTDHGVQIVVSRGDLSFLDGSVVDFAADGLNHTFRFHNPNVTEECGCGESFTIEKVA